MSYMDVLWIKIATSYSKWTPLARTQSLSHCGHPLIKLRNTPTGKSAAAFRRNRFKLSILGFSTYKPSPDAWTTICSPRSLGPNLQKVNLKWRWSPEYSCPATAGLSVPCVLGLSPAGSSSRPTVHGRGCCKKRHPNIGCLKLKPPLRKAAADFPVVVYLRNLIDERPQRFKDSVRANGGHF